jgi:hypothetical protein
VFYREIQRQLDRLKVERALKAIRGYLREISFKERHGLARLILLEKSCNSEDRRSFSRLGLVKSEAANGVDLIEQEVYNVDPEQEIRRYVFPQKTNIHKGYCGY